MPIVAVAYLTIITTDGIHMPLNICNNKKKIAYAYSISSFVG
jgi:hypothetical protein